MTGWTAKQLATLNADDSVQLQASSTPIPATQSVEVGVVTVGEDAYVRAYRGAESTWFQAALTCGQGVITTSTFHAEVRFDLAAPPIADRVDAAYRTKYGHHGAAAIRLVLSSTAKAATLKITPRAQIVSDSGEPGSLTSRGLS